MDNPLGIDEANPLFSWKIRGENGCFQKDYRITVAVSEQALEEGDLLWDSGIVASSKTYAVRYEGKKLADCMLYCWRVAVNGVWSGTARFETAFLSKPMPCAYWIGMPLAFHGGTIILRTDFRPKSKVRRARFYLAALGCARCFLNGSLLADTYFDGALSVYHKRIFYRTYALELRDSNNSLCVELGYGFYGAEKMKGELRVEYENGETDLIPTLAGRVWNVTHGCVTENSVYGGEIFDARLKKDWLLPEYAVSTSEFVAAYCVDAPAGALRACPIPAMRVVRKFSPVSFTEQGENTILIDAGENITGWLRIKVKGERGGRIILRYAEVLGSNGKINQANLRTAKNQDVYILCGEGVEEYAPAFTYHGFRYVEIEADGARLIEAAVEHVRTDIAKCGDFSCSDERLNSLHEMAQRTESNNLNGVFTDCPQRDERLGWLNDMSSRIFEAICNFDLRCFLPNFVGMITDSQDEAGAFGDTVPFTVGSAIADTIDSYHLLAWLAYRFYGDLRVLERNYEGFSRWSRLLEEQYLHDGIVEWGLYGDWCPAAPFAKPESNTHSALVSPQFMSGLYHLWNLELLAKIARTIGRVDDAVAWERKRQKGKEFFLQKYLDRKSGRIGGGSQTECAAAMTVFTEEKALCAQWAKAAAEDIVRRGYHMTCGNQGYRHLFYRLAEYGYAEDLMKLLVNEEYPGWGYMLKQGATTVWERWEADICTDMHSFNHPMFASYDGYLYNYLAGIRTDLCDDAFGKIVIEPCFVPSLEQVSARLDTVRGEISVEWHREKDRIVLNIQTPANTQLSVRAANKRLCCGKFCARNELQQSNGKFSIIIENE